MNLNVGAKVMVALDHAEQIPTNKQLWEYQGQERVISRRRIIAYGRGGCTRGTYYELKGVVSEMGVPFGFLEEQLVPLD